MNKETFKPEESDIRRGNIDDWAKALESVDEKLSKELGSKRMMGFESLDKLNLPRYKRKTLPLSIFLEDPTGVLDEMQSELLYVTLLPKAEGLRKFAKDGANQQEVLKFIKENIESDQTENYDITVQQYFRNLYGGNVIVNPDGKVIVEFRAGKQGPIAKGSETPKFTATNNNPLGNFEYSFSDEKLRKTIFGMLQTIPHEDTGHYAKYNPGYYEFVIVKRDDNSAPEPIFIDYQNQPAYFTEKKI